ncbi:pyridoxal phosphate-dependent aminotransferase [Mycobacterium hubeiense]|uniref:pyridoxal phosphate-dependent aminotransferase n=1 Tax=Mycobacterium hubeiense TaxID=1867256 RepID=UPI000C7F381B|nr:aminotransferase class I/II-fold pyridoxal phosphate-dependent enzyme [Mycobacterium sp. QGD 101]
MSILSQVRELDLRTDTLAALPAAVNPMALALNENPFPPLPAVRSAVSQAVGVANRYPEFLPERLRSLIGARIGVLDEQVVLGAGATGVVSQALHAMTHPGDRIVLSTPTFDGYPILTRMARLTSVQVPLDEYGHHDLDAMADAATDAKVVVLCRPHNPTGTLESAADVERFLRHVPRETMVLLDEAYIEFVTPEHRLDSAQLVARFPNLVVLRTFSKAYGLAGLRIGYGFASPELAEELSRMQLPFGMSITSAVAVAACYEAEDQLAQRIRFITDERRHLRRRLQAMGIVSTDSHANFVYLPQQGRPWREVFRDTGLQLRYFDNGALRITAAGRASTQAVLAALAR